MNARLIPAIMDEKAKHSTSFSGSPPIAHTTLSPNTTIEDGEQRPRTWWSRVKEPGSVWQIIIAAILAIAIGLAVTTTVDEVPEAVTAILAIPGNLWLRALKAVVLPMIATAMILAVQRLRAMSEGGAGNVARWTIGYYVLTTLIAIGHSTILVALVWSRLMVTVSGDALAVDAEQQKVIDDRKSHAVHDVIVDMVNSLVPANVVNALATDALLSVLVSSVVVGYCLSPGSSILRAVEEIEGIVMKIITVLIKLAPIGVFFLIMPNLFRLDITEIGRNLGVLIGGTLACMAIHLFIVLPLIVIVITRRNPYGYWMKNSPAWITAWGTASSAATLPVTMRCVLASGVPASLANFVIPLGCLINMDGTAIYFPIVVVFLAATQGISLTPANYVIVVLLATLASIGTTPIPSSSLVLTVMIAQSVGVPITGMYAVVVAIDWFLDRFRTAVNVSGDLFAAMVIQKVTGITDDPVEEDVEVGNDITRTMGGEVRV